MTRPRLGFIGLGAMGAPMAQHLLRRGYTVNVWARTPSKIAGLDDAGAAQRDTPRDVATNSDVVLLCLYDAASVETVDFGPDGITSATAADVVSTTDGALSSSADSTRWSWTPNIGTDSGTAIMPACSDARLGFLVRVDLSSE